MPRGVKRKAPAKEKDKESPNLDKNKKTTQQQKDVADSTSVSTESQQVQQTPEPTPSLSQTQRDAAEFDRTPDDSLSLFAPITRDKRHIDETLHNVQGSLKEKVKKQKKMEEQAARAERSAQIAVMKRDRARAEKRMEKQAKDHEEFLKAKLIRKIKTLDSSAAVNKRMALPVLAETYDQLQKKQYRGLFGFIMSSVLLTSASMTETFLPWFAQSIGVPLDLSGFTQEVKNSMTSYRKIMDDMIDEMDIPRVTPGQMFLFTFAGQVVTVAAANAQKRLTGTPPPAEPSVTPRDE